MYPARIAPREATCRREMQVVICICIVSGLRYVLLHRLILDYLDSTNSIPSGTLSMAGAVIGAVALMIYSKWAWRKTVGKNEAGSMSMMRSRQQEG